MAGPTHIRKLNYLGILYCHKLFNIFPWNMLERLPKLEDLRILCCNSVQEISEPRALRVGATTELAETIPSFVFPELTFLKLLSLPILKSFYPGLHISEWPMLRKLIVRKCAQLELLASEILSPQETHHADGQHHSQIPQPLFFIDKVAFPCLERLELSNLPELLHLWKDNSRMSKVFRNLETLDISECGNLDTLVQTPRSFQNLKRLRIRKRDRLINLVKLTGMHIAECKMITEIIKHVEELKDCNIVFGQLEYMGLDCLPCLTSFCLGNYTLEFPSLEQVLVRESPKMKIFSEGVLDTLELNKVQLTEDDDKGFWEGNLNDTVRQLFKQKIE